MGKQSGSDLADTKKMNATNECGRLARVPKRAALIGIVIVSAVSLGTSLASADVEPTIKSAPDSKVINDQVDLPGSHELKQALDGLIAYASAHEKMLPGWSNWRELLEKDGYALPELEKLDDPDHDGVTIEYMGGLVTKDSNQIVVYEDPDHRESHVLVGFVDGRVELVTHHWFWKKIKNRNRRYLRTVLQGMIVYAANQQGVFPWGEQWEQLLLDAGIVTPVMLDIADRDGDGEIYINVSGGEITHDGDESDASEIVIYEDPDHYKMFVIVGFADAHIEVVGQTKFKRMLEKQLGIQD